MFWRKRNKTEQQQQQQPGPDLSSSIYTVSEEDLSPGFEEVYVPFLTITVHGNDELVFARFIDGTVMVSIEEAYDELIRYVERRYKGCNMAYRRLPDTSLSHQEKQVLDRMEQQLQQWIPKQED